MSVKQSITKRNPAKLNEWNLRTSGFNVKFKSSLYVNGNYLLGYSNQVIHSTDSITWTARTTGSLNAGVFADESAKVLRYYDNKYFLIHAGNELLVSTDTIVWQIRTALTEYAGIVKDDAGLFHVVGSVNNPQIAFSTDTITWTLRTSGVSLDGHYAYGNGIHMLATTQGLPIGGVNISTDGVVWENSSNQIYALINSNRNFEYANGIFRLTKTLGYRSYTTDGIVWFPSDGGSTRFGSPPAIARGISFNAGTWIMVGENGIIETSNSNDDLSWTTRTSNTSTNLNTVASADGSFLVAGESGVVLINTNELEKTTTTRPGLVFYNDRISGIVTVADADDVSTKNYVDNTPGFIVPTAADEGKFLTTTDGVNQSFEEISNYQEYTTPGSYTFNLPPSANLLYVQAVNGGDGGSTGRNPGESLILEDISNNFVFGGNSSSSASTLISDVDYVVASGYSSKLYVSTDNIVWTARTHGHAPNNSARALNYANGLYYYTSTLTCTVSTDTIVWSDVVYTVDSDLPRNFLYVPENDLYIMNTSIGKMHVSTDGTVWTARTSGFTGGGGDFLYHEGIYLSGVSSALIASTDTIHWAARTTSMDLIGGDPRVHLTRKPNSDLVVATHASSAAVSTDTVIWITRTYNGNFSKSIASSKELYVIGNSGTPVTYYKSTDSVTWVSFLLNDPNDTVQTFGTAEVSFGKNAFLFNAANSNGAEKFIVNIARTKYSGSSGGGSDYSEWYLNKNILYSDLTIDVGSGGIGATTVDTTGQVGSATTISWTGPNASLYKVSPSSSVSLSSNSIYSSQGSLSSAFVIDDNSNGYDGANQTNKNQSTGGGSGSVESGIGGSGGEIYDFGFGEKASGGYGFEPSELDGQDAVLNSTLPYGGGGGGGSISAGYSWILRTSGKSINASFYSSVIGRGYYVLGSQNFILSSTDTIVWEQQNEGGSFNVYGLAEGPEFFLAAGGPNGYVSTSTNAVVWILRTAGFSDIVQQAIYDGNEFIISGDNAFLAISTDAVHWTKRTTGVSITEPIEGLGYANGYYFIGHPNATPSVSTDTITWIKRTAFVDSYKAFGYQNGYYVMTDGGADVISSTDTVVWIKRTTGNISGGIGNNNLGVTPTGFIIQGKDGGNTDQWYSTSTDSITWIVRTSNNSVIRSVRSITYGDGYALVGGNNGYVEVSPVYIGSGGDGVRGGGGGGGAVGFGTFGAGGNGGDGYVKITWW